jgi:dihydrofolate reductase
MKLTTTFVSVDGVMQRIGGREEDPSGGFERGGWTVPHFDNETAMFVRQIYRRADAFLLGRRTYEIFAGSREQWQIRATTHRGGIEHAAQVRGIDHTHQHKMGEHDRYLQ